MLKIEIELDENTLRQLIQQHLSDNGINVEPNDIKIEVKSVHYKSEWETVTFRAKVVSLK